MKVYCDEKDCTNFTEEFDEMINWKCPIHKQMDTDELEQWLIEQENKLTGGEDEK